MTSCCDRLAQFVTDLTPTPILSASSNAFLLALTQSTKAGLLTGLIVFAILTGTVGFGTMASLMLHRTSGKKALAIAVLVAMITCAIVIAFTTTPVIYMHIN